MRPNPTLYAATIKLDAHARRQATRLEGTDYEVGLPVGMRFGGKEGLSCPSGCH
jgi:hypothetical protein